MELQLCQTKQASQLRQVLNSAVDPNPKDMKCKFILLFVLVSDLLELFGLAEVVDCIWSLSRLVFSRENTSLQSRSIYAHELSQHF